MPIDYHIDHDRRLAMVSVRGVVGADEVYTQAVNQVQDPTFLPGMNTFYDCRESTLVGDIEPLVRLAEFLNNEHTEHLSPYCALLVDEQVQQDTAQLFCFLAESSPTEYKIFYSERQAFDWLAATALK